MRLLTNPDCRNNHKNPFGQKTIIRSLMAGLIGMISAVSFAEEPAAPATKADLSEFEEALRLTPDPQRGKELYKRCVTCHGPEGWGYPGSSYPQIAGQLQGVIIKQMADFRANNRDNPIMRAFTSQRSLGGPQDIADVAAYIASLPMTPNNERGFPINLALGEEIYQRDCEECHGKEGVGIAEDFGPKLQGQHYGYLMRQFDWIRNGRRRNANEKMVKQIKGFTPREQAAVMSYLANIIPEDVATPDWRNSDFSNYDRSWRPSKIR